MKRTIYLTLLLLLLSLSNGFSQQLSKSQNDSIKYWCSQPNGIEKVKIIVDKVFGVGLRYQAAALKINYDEALTEEAESQCGISKINPSEITSFTFDTTGKRAFKFYEWYECKSDWDNSCEGDEDLILPAGWQVCSCLYNVTSQRGNADNPIITPIQWYEGDSEYPYRFRGYHIKLRSSGNNEFLNRVGANISLSDVRIIAIPSSFTNEDRYKLGCDMPVYPIAKPKVEPTKDDTEPTKIIKAEYVYSSQKCSYDVYKGDGIIGCDDWTYVGKVTSSNSIKVTIQQGENISIRVMKNGAEVCKASKIKQEDNVYLLTNATKSSINKYELHDWECE